MFFSLPVYRADTVKHDSDLVFCKTGEKSGSGAKKTAPYAVRPIGGGKGSGFVRIIICVPRGMLCLRQD